MKILLRHTLCKNPRSATASKLRELRAWPWKSRGWASSDQGDNAMELVGKPVQGATFGELRREEVQHGQISWRP
jgi:hypothetical protein